MKEEANIFQTDADQEKTIRSLKKLTALKIMKTMKMPAVMTDAYVRSGGTIVPVFDAYTGQRLPLTKDDMNRMEYLRNSFNSETCMIIKISEQQSGYAEIDLFPGVGMPETKCFTKLDYADDDSFTLVAPGFFFNDGSFGYTLSWTWTQVTIKGKRLGTCAWDVDFIGRAARPCRDFLKKYKTSAEEDADYWDEY
ncbi:MAG: hypothetical protein IJM02_00305 [Clostridia bacterium]|nr:hypothetical protein [Clostridia bacterium]